MVDRIAGVVLAAGLSKRMKTNKLLLPLGDKTVIERTLDNIFLAGLTAITVVIGHMKEEVRAKLAGYQVRFVVNPCYAQGMGTSLSAGVRSVMNDSRKAAVLSFNGDMPFIKPSTIKGIIAGYMETKAPIVMPCYAGKRGHPVLLDRSLFPELLDIPGDKGARELLKKYEQQIVLINVEDPGICQDIDSPADYEKIKRGQTGKKP